MLTQSTVTTTRRWAPTTSTQHGDLSPPLNTELQVTSTQQSDRSPPLNTEQPSPPLNRGQSGHLPSAMIPSRPPLGPALSGQEDLPVTPSEEARPHSAVPWPSVSMVAGLAGQCGRSPAGGVPGTSLHEGAEETGSQEKTQRRESSDCVWGAEGTLSGAEQVL